MGLERHRRPAPSPPTFHPMALALPGDTEVGWTGEEENEGIKNSKDKGRFERKRRRKRGALRIRAVRRKGVELNTGIKYISHLPCSNRTHHSQQWGGRGDLKAHVLQS